MKEKMKAGWIIIAIGVALLPLAIPAALAADAVTVTAPDGAENWSATQSITWTFTTDDAVNDTFNVSWSADGGASYTSIITGKANTSTTHSWDTSGRTDGAGYRIRVTKHNTNVSDVNDSSDANFTVDNTAPVVAITMTSAGLESSDYVYTLATTLNFDGTITDALSGNKNISLGGTSGTITTNAWTTSSVSISTGCNVVTATGYDYAGNAGTDTCTVCRSVVKTGSSYVPPTPTPYAAYQPPPAAGFQPLTIIPEEGVPDEAVKFGFLAVVAVVLFVVWRKWK